MKSHKEFRLQLMQSSYFNPDATASPIDIVKAFGAPFKNDMVYYHLKKHQDQSITKTKRKLKELQDKGILKNTIDLVETTTDSTTLHEIGLDQFIQQGRDNLASHELPISAPTYLQAIKIKADIEKTTKDRRLEAMKSMFSGGGASGNAK